MHKTSNKINQISTTRDNKVQSTQNHMIFKINHLIFQELGLFSWSTETFEQSIFKFHLSSECCTINVSPLTLVWGFMFSLNSKVLHHSLSWQCYIMCHLLHSGLLCCTLFPQSLTKSYHGTKRFRVQPSLTLRGLAIWVEYQLT